MFRTKLINLPRLIPTASPSADPARLIPSCLPDPVQKQTQSESDPVQPSSPTRRASAQLSRWSRARSIRSGRRLSWPALREKAGSSGPATVPPRSPSADSSTSSAGDMKEQMDEMDGLDGFGEEMSQGKQIYMVSDGTGWTAEHSVNAALGQFEHCLVDRGCPVNTHLFSGVEDTDRLLEIIKQAAKEGALLLYTLADPTMAEAARQACQLWGVRATDILSPTTEAIAAHLGVAPSGIPRGAPGRQGRLSDDYFKRIEAIDFTIKQDDGAQPQNLNRANIVLVGVSRTGKTPLSIYLAQKGYKVANVPIVMGLNLPKSLFEINQEKIFGLTINPTVLQAIRKARAKALGFHAGVRSNYSEMDHVRSELEFARKIFAENPSWPVIEVTGKAIEETAAVIVRMYHDKKQKNLMPRISRRY